MQLNKKLGDKINRGFMLVVFILGAIIAVRFVIAVSKQNWKPPYEYKENTTNQPTTGR